MWDCSFHANGTKVTFEEETRPHVRTSNSDWVTLDDFMNSYMEVEESVRRRIGHQFHKDEADSAALTEVMGAGLVHEGMFRRCHFKGRPCMNQRYWNSSLVCGLYISPRSLRN